MAIVLQLESAQKYRALMVIYQSHRTPSVLTLHDALPMPYLMCFWDIPGLVSCALSAIPIFNSSIFLFAFMYEHGICEQLNLSVLSYRQNYTLIIVVLPCKHIIWLHNI